MSLSKDDIYNMLDEEIEDMKRMIDNTKSKNYSGIFQDILECKRTLAELIKARALFEQADEKTVDMKLPP